MRSIKSISGKLKWALLKAGWKQVEYGYWQHPKHRYYWNRWLGWAKNRHGIQLTRFIDGYTLRAAAKR